MVCGAFFIWLDEKSKSTGKSACATGARKNRTPGKLGCGFGLWIECWTENFSVLGVAWARVGTERPELRPGGRPWLARLLERLPGRGGARESRRSRLRGQ